MTGFRTLVLAALAGNFAGCARSCSAPEPPPAPIDDVPPPTPLLPPRCVREITRAAVAIPPGTGDVDTIVPTCAGNTLALYVLRGHVLSRITRSLRPGAGFGTPVTVSTGVDRVGPMADTAVDGPVAWRSPVAGLDDPERDDLWAAFFESGDGGVSTVLRGDVFMPLGTAGIGSPVATGVVDGRVEVLATIARQGEDPVTARIGIPLGRDGVEMPAGGAPGVIDGEIRAWEPRLGYTLSRVIEPDGARRVMASRPGHSGMRVPVGGPEVLVAPRGAYASEASVFLLAGFALGNDAGRCLNVGDLCVTPGPVELLVVRDGSVARLTVAPAGLPDAVTSDGQSVDVLYVDGAGAQVAARVEIPQGTVHLLSLAPPEGLPSIDHPTLVTCEDGTWLAAELSLARPDGGTRPAVTALPLECLAR